MEPLARVKPTRSTNPTARVGVIARLQGRSVSERLLEPATKCVEEDPAEVRVLQTPL
jgi:hypothetical protein